MLKSLTLIAAAVALTIGALATGPAPAHAAHSHLVASSAGCPGDNSTTSSSAAQLRAMRCLVNTARRRAGLSTLRTDRVLERAASIKASRIEACGQFTHTPCGAPFTASFRAAGWRGETMGENIAYGQSYLGTPRAIFEAWLASPDHRANLLRPSFRRHGLAVRTANLPGVGLVQLWVHAFGR